ncbi:MAG: IS3 family transposase [Balneolaceae bacterium]|nr:IS3 family transposase [Balneolaceae bacterium]
MQASRLSKQSEQLVLELVRSKRAHHPRLGTRKLHRLLSPEFTRQSLKIGRDKLFGVLRAHNLLVPKRKARGPRTTDGARTWWKNILDQTPIEAPHQGWVADISYLHTMEGFCYMALISDVYSRKIVGWDVSESLELEGALRALNMALADLPEGKTPVHHSDRGSQYRSKDYTRRLQDAGCLISMTEVDHCAENAQAERVNGILKGEYYLDMVFRDTRQAKQAVKAAIKLYNEERPHLSLKYQFPEQVHRAA